MVETVPKLLDSEFALYVMPCEWNLPSLDPECLTVMVTFKLANQNNFIKIFNFII